MLDRLIYLITGIDRERIRREQERAAVVEAIEQRWRETNARTRARGCRCGAPATRVRYALGTTGSVPMEIWTCEAHFGVSSWWSEDGGRTWVPCSGVPGADQWIVDDPHRFNLSTEDDK